MNNHKKQILTLILGFTVCGGMANSILGMEPTREELERYTETEFARASGNEKKNMWANASSQTKNALWDNATNEQRYQILTKIAGKEGARKFMAANFTKTWLELDTMKKNILNVTEPDTEGNQISKEVHNAILKGIFDKAMLWRVESHWDYIFRQYRKTLAPISTDVYMSMMKNNTTPLGHVVNVYYTKLIQLLELIMAIEKEL